MLAKLTSIPVLSWLIRYWRLHAFTILLVLCALNERVFTTLGALIYVPAIVVLNFDVATLVRHLFANKTLDKDAADGTFALEWRTLTPDRRVSLSIYFTIGILVSGAIIAASVGK